MDPDARTSFYLQVEENRKRDALKMLDELINAEMPREEERDASVTDNCDLLAQLGSEDFPFDLELLEPYLRSMTARRGVRKLAEQLRSQQRVFVDRPAQDSYPQPQDIERRCSDKHPGYCPASCAAPGIVETVAKFLHLYNNALHEDFSITSSTVLSITSLLLYFRNLAA